MTKTHDSEGIQPFHPTLLNATQLKPYQTEFKVALSDPKITNIAVSGSYGAGKSTLVDSWEALVSKNEEPHNSQARPWIHISLAGFSGEKQYSVSDQTIQERDVEGELINQLIFKLSHRNAPKSRFSITEDQSRLKDFVIALYWLGMVLLCILVISGWNSNELPWAKDCVLPTLSVVLLFWMIPLFYKGVQSQAVRRALKRLKLFNAEVEVFNQDSDPAFNRYMDDLVYLLTKSRCTVFVFEDLDRFQDVSLFEKLRRVNELVNNRRRDAVNECPLGHKKYINPIKFIYLIHDSLFQNPKDRTKFFDLIIPVIPYVDPSNSADVLSQGLEKAGVKASKTFLHQLSLYIDDPRIIKDICNESRHYKQVLVRSDKQPKFWDDNKLVGMMAYKALFPEDFECLQVREGYVFSIFEKKDDLVATKTQDVRSKIEGLKRQIDELEAAETLTTKEIELIGAMCDYHVRNTLGQWLSNSENEIISEEDFFNAIEKDNDVRQAIESTISKLRETDSAFKQRLEISSKDKSEAIDEIVSKIEKQKRTIAQIARQTLSELLESTELSERFFGNPNNNENENDSHIESIKKNKYFPMLRFLLVQGYIDETYQLYMSNRYNGSLTMNDERFLFELLGSYSIEPDYKLENPDAVLMRVDPGLLARKSARNYSLFRNVIVTHSDEHIQSLLRGIATDNDDQFVLGYILSDQLDNSAYGTLAELYPSCIAQVILDGAITLSDKRTFCKKVLSSAESHMLVELSKRPIADFANQDALFLEDLDILDERTFEQALKDIGYTASQIDFTKAKSSLLKFVSMNKMFEQRAQIVHGLAISTDTVEINSYEELNNVLATSNNELIVAIRQRLLEDMDGYISSLLEECSAPLKDKDAAVAMVLNSKSLTSEEVETKYISSLENDVKKLNLIQDSERMAALLNQRKCLNTTENLCAYFKTLGKDDDDLTISSYLNAKGVPCDMSPNIMIDNGVNPDDFIRAYAPMASGLDDDKLKAIAESLKSSSSELSCSSLDSNRIRILIEAGYITVREQSLNELRQINPELAQELAKTNIDAYANLVLANENESPVCQFDDNEVLGLFEAIQISSPSLVNLVGGLKQKVSLSDTYLDEINVEIISKDKFNGNIENLCEVYKKAKKSLRKAIVTYVGMLAPYQVEIVFEKIGKDANPITAKFFLAEYLSCLENSPDRSALMRYTRLAGLEKYASLIEASKKSASIETSEADDMLIHALQKLKFIGRDSKKVSKKGSRQVYSKRSRIFH